LRIDNSFFLEEASICLSPNFSEREADDISLLVLHNISLPPGEFGGGNVEKFFLNELDSDEHPYFKEIHDLKVSSHLYIKRDGSIIQFVPLDKKAWHAGVSSFKGKQNCNEFSIGIELEGTDDIPYEKAQYLTLIRITLALMEKYPYLKKDNIVGHSDIAPERKTDPGGSFDWVYYLSQLD
tara:strand:- start:501 stop:1043 length:543 start_codon:yes stop_codon:yes gene_type:complete